MTGPGEDTDIIPGLRPSDTAPLPLELPAHRGRHRRRMSRAALVAAWGAPTAVVALLVGHSLPGLVGSGGDPRMIPPAVASSPSTSDTPETGEPTSVRPSMSRADRARPRTSSPAPSPSAASPTPSRTPSPTRQPEPSSPSPSMAPTQSSPPPTSEPPDSPGPEIQIPPPVEEPTDGQ